ncbi:hypothetical protein [Nocardioides speluncae]|uniref:hypothetical protein n=1 Tax=Nocardioides speluncae TaxID=2670337 RepID=UPI000D691D2A|nr:hypothetical protein [Nocardioides speluncae]
MRRTRPFIPLSIATAVGLALLGCSASGSGEDGVFETGVEPVPLDIEAPTYAVATPRGLTVRAGQHQRFVPNAVDAAWLPNGTALVRRDGVRLYDPATGRLAGTAIAAHELPSRAVTRITTWGDGITAYDLSGRKVATYDLPGISSDEASEDTDPTKVRDYHGAIPTIDGATFVRWTSGISWADWDEEQYDYGVLRIEGDEREEVLVNERIIGLYLSADGAALLALRNRKTDPCGGCNVTQEIVELDPETGQIAGRYGMPDAYTKNWDVDAIDKVGDRVAVRFHEPVWEDEDDPSPTDAQRGTWVYDGDGWTMVKGSDTELTWWQGPDDRIVARVDDSEPTTEDGFDLFWVHGDRETPIEGELDLFKRRTSRYGAVAGQLLRPE